MVLTKPYKRAGYKPATLIQETYDRVASRDSSLMFLFSYIYESFNDTEEPDVDIDIDIDMSVALSYADNSIVDIHPVRVAARFGRPLLWV